MSNMFSSFSHTLQFEPIDPLGDGLREDIAQEQSDPESIAFQQELNGESLTNFWDEVVGQDVHEE